jgi:hypothetical protein
VGAALVVAHVDFTSPPGVTQPATASLPDPNHLPNAANVRTISVAGTRGLRFDSTVQGVPSEVVLVPRGSKGYTVTLVPAGSVRAERQLEAMLASLRLP